MLVLVALVGGISGTSWQAVRATRAEVTARTERDDKEQARAAEAEQRAAAVAALATSRRRLVEPYVGRGVRLLEEGDSFGSLLRFAEALDQDRGDPAREAVHRLRMASIVRYGPRPVHAWFHGGPVHAVAFSPDGRRAASGSRDGTARVWDLATGAAVTPPIKHASSLGGTLGSGR